MSCDATILVLLSKDEFARGKYVANIEIVSAKKAKSVIKTRAKEDGFVLEKCLGNTGKSPEKSIQLTEGRCNIQFEVTDALKPVKEFRKGENVLEYMKGKEGCRTILTLVRNPHDPTTAATIVFTAQAQDRFLHRVTIDDVPLPGGQGSTELGVVENFGASVSVSDSVPGRVSEHVVTDYSYGGSADADNEASPVAPRQQSCMPEPPGPARTLGPRQPEEEGEEEVITPAPSQLPLQTATIHQPDGGGGGGGGDSGSDDSSASDEYDDVDEDTGSIPSAAGGGGGAGGDRPPPVHTSLSTSSFRDDTPLGRALCDVSLNSLTAALSPPEANRMFAGFGIAEALIKQAHRNNQGDIVQAHYEILRHWRHRHAEEGVNNLYAALLQELSTIGRNDIKIAIEFAVQENRQLTKEDLGL